MIFPNLMVTQAFAGRPYVMHAWHAEQMQSLNKSHHCYRGFQGGLLYTGLS
jgi:hypothetical protein